MERRHKRLDTEIHVYERRQDQLYRQLMERAGEENCHLQSIQELSVTMPSVHEFDWSVIPPCVFPDVFSLLKSGGSGGNVQTATDKLISHAACFDVVTAHPSFQLIMQCMDDGSQESLHMIADQILQPGIETFINPAFEEEDEETMRETLENLQKHIPAHDAAFMKRVGNGLRMAHGNWHTTLCAIAHRHHLLGIVELINQGKITSALTEVRKAVTGHHLGTCENCRNPAIPAWKIVNGRAVHPESQPPPSLTSASNCEEGEVKIELDKPLGGSLLPKNIEVNWDEPPEGQTPPTCQLHQLFQTICTVLDSVALQMDTAALIMLRRTCKHASQYHPDVPIYTADRHGTGRTHFGLSSRLALSYQQQITQLEKEKGAPLVISRAACFIVDWRINNHIMNDDNNGQNCISEVHQWIVGRRRQTLLDRFHYLEASTNSSSKTINDVLRSTGSPNSTLKDAIRSGKGSRRILLNTVMADTTVDGLPKGSALTESDQRGLLVAACESNNYKAVNFLMYELGICPGCADDFHGTTPMHAAAAAGNIRIMQQLCTAQLIGASQPMPPEGQSLLDNLQRSVLGCAIENGHVDAVRWLIEECGWALDNSLERRIVTNALSSLEFCFGIDKRIAMETLLRFYLSGGII